MIGRSTVFSCIGRVIDVFIIFGGTTGAVRAVEFFVVFGASLIIGWVVDDDDDAIGLVAWAVFIVCLRWVSEVIIVAFVVVCGSVWAASFAVDAERRAWAVEVPVEFS